MDAGRALWVLRNARSTFSTCGVSIPYSKGMAMTPRAPWSQKASSSVFAC